MLISELNEALSKQLSNTIVTFAYRKNDGTIRVAHGTANLDNVPENFHPAGKYNTSSNGSKRYYDVEKEQWRSFRIDNLIFVMEVGFVDNISEEDKAYITNLAIPA